LCPIHALHEANSAGLQSIDGLPSGSAAPAVAVHPNAVLTLAMCLAGRTGDNGQDSE